MPWIDLLSNQMVSFTDAQTGGFTLKAGQSNENSLRCMTKAEALAKYNLVAASMSAYADNQLVPKITWVPVAVPLPVTGLNWTTTTGGYTNNNTLVGEPLSGITGCESAGWVITNNNLKVRFNVALSANCFVPEFAGGCNVTQKATATATITVGAVDTYLNISWIGMGERQDTNYDKMRFVLDGVEVSRGNAPGGNLQCLDGPIVQTIVVPGPYFLPANTVHTLLLDFTTADAAFHVNSYYEANLSFT
jgi:hypothetical protein